jgi:glutamate carboxypeptidase
LDPLLQYARSAEEDITALIRRFVECESPSGERAAVDRFVDLVADTLAGEARIRFIPGGGFGRHLRAEFILPGRRKRGQVLARGHTDTVWPLGTLAHMPWRRAPAADGSMRLWGPGVLDMKAGIAFFISATRALRELDLPVESKVVLLLNADEEVGSASSRPWTEKEALGSHAVLVLEPGTGLEGKLKTVRKGVGSYMLKVNGQAAHAGVDFTAGASAIVELARQIGKIAGFTKLERGLTVNPGVIHGGTRSNVIAAEASAEIDFRVLRLRDAAPLDRRFRALRPFDRRCSLTVEGGLNRPPLERSPGVVKLYRLARRLGAELGVGVAESLTGGGSDGNFTAALGVPTLDGLGATGEGAHAPHESILTARIADRTALLAKLLVAIKPVDR